MRPERHLLCGTVLSVGIMIKHHKIDTAIACLIGSAAPDIDHLIEYSKYCKDYSIEPKFDEFISGTYFDKKGTVYVFLHSWEIAIISLGYVFFRRQGKCNKIIKGLVVGYTSHMILDQIGNNLSGLSYFWLYRWWHDWEQKCLLEK